MRKCKKSFPVLVALVTALLGGCSNSAIEHTKAVKLASQAGFTVVEVATEQPMSDAVVNLVARLDDCTVVIQVNNNGVSWDDPSENTRLGHKLNATPEMLEKLDACDVAPSARG